MLSISTLLDCVNILDTLWFCGDFHSIVEFLHKYRSMRTERIHILLVLLLAARVVSVPILLIVDFVRPGSGACNMWGILCRAH